MITLSYRWTYLGDGEGHDAGADGAGGAGAVSIAYGIPAGS